MRLRAVLPPFVVAVLATALLAPAAAATQAPIVFSPDITGQGPDDLIHYDGSYFTPGQSVVVTITAEADGTTYRLPDAAADSRGDVAPGAGVRTPAALTPGRYRLTLTQSGGLTAQSPAFTIVPPSVAWPTGVVPGSRLDLILLGLGSGPDVRRQVTIDGTAVTSLAFATGSIDVGQSVDIPNTLRPGPHTIALTQNVNPAHTASATVVVATPTMRPRTTYPLGLDSPVTAAATGFGVDDVVAVAVTGGAGEVHAAPDVRGATPSFSARIPTLTPGRVTVTFTSRHNGATASTTFLVNPFTVTAPATLTGGDRLVLNQLQSDLTMQSDGNLVIRNFGDPVWTSRTPGHPGARLDVQGDGNLVLRDASGRAYWSTGTAGFGARARFGMGQDGNVVLSAANGRPLWSSTLLPNTLFVPQGTQVTAGHGLPKGALIASELRRSTFGIRADGNAVVTDGRGRVVWASNTGGHPNAYVSVQTDGNVVIRSATNAALWATHTRSGPGARLIMQADGNLVLRAADGRAVWSTRTTNGF